ncbi:MAG: hypothetical protein ACHP7N_01235 [Caulobacterales bacterium]
MIVSKTPFRERLIGQPLIGFQTETGVARVPSVKAGPSSETKTKPKPAKGRPIRERRIGAEASAVRIPRVMVLNSEIKANAAVSMPTAMVAISEIKPIG